MKVLHSASVTATAKYIHAIASPSCPRAALLTRHRCIIYVNGYVNMCCILPSSPACSATLTPRVEATSAWRRLRHCSASYRWAGAGVYAGLQDHIMGT